MKYIKLTACLAAAVMSCSCLNVLPQTVSSFGSITAYAEDSDFVCGSIDAGLVITEYTGEGGDVVIPEKIGGTKVVGIWDNAFFQCDAITSVKLPDTILTIEDSAFFDCTALTDINIPNGVTKIGPCAFSGCTSLKKISIPDSTDLIAEAAFQDCTALNEVKLPDKAVKIMNDAFLNCSSLKEITIPKGIEKIYDGAFGMYMEEGEDPVYSLYKDFKINCYKYSVGHKYADDNDINYVILDPQTPDKKDIDTLVPDKKPKGALRGDVNGDGSIDVSDIATLASHIKGIKALDESKLWSADANGDLHVNVTDIAVTAAHIKGIKPIEQEEDTDQDKTDDVTTSDEDEA